MKFIQLAISPRRETRAIPRSPQAWVRLCCTALLLVPALGCAAPPDAPPPAFRLEQVAPGNWVHEGVTVPFDDPRSDDIANIGFIVGERCVAVVDTGGSARIGAALRAAIGRTTRVPVCYVINTHDHYDHVLGNAAFLADKPEFIGHADLPDAIAADREFFLREYAANLGPGASADSVVAPSRTVADTLELDLGGRTIRLSAFRPAHSHTDLTVYDLNTRTLWTGDLVFIQRVPALDGSLTGWLEALTGIEALPAARIVPGHGPASAPWPAAAAPERKYLTTLLRETRESLAQGKFLEDVIETQGREDANAWLLFDQHHGRNVSKAYTELEWE